MTCLRRRTRGDMRGNISVFVAVAIIVGMLLCTAVARLGSATAEKSRANNAADASALAAADRLALGQSPAEACSVARRTAADNGARLLTCHGGAAAAETMAAEVTLEIGDAHAKARAEVDANAAVAP
jgi:secretion/DNA translocation related TadE-like protein